jgi:CRISPR-associated protein Csy3
MIAEMQLKFLDLDGALSACAPSASDNRDDIRNLRTSIDDFIARAKTSDGLLAVACRYARNIANGRWLWRNRTLASSIEITVYSHDVEVAKFDALSVPMRHFNDVSEGELAVGKLIRDGLIGASYSAIRIEARVDFGVRGSIEVFPSQNYLEKKTTGFARSLYCLGHAEVEDPTAIRIMGRAAMRDQKVANALRTIDTWYPQYAVLGKPIPVEPNGASLDAAEFFREKKTSSFDMVRRLNSIDPSSDEGMFVIANLIRGGVYSEGSPPDTSVKPKKRG